MALLSRSKDTTTGAAGLFQIWIFLLLCSISTYSQTPAASPSPQQPQPQPQAPQPQPQASPQQQEFAKGVVIERVVTQADASQSYALFLPPNYSPDKRWPIIYAFEPLARAALPVNLFKDAAIKYGYIVAASYNSRNGMQAAPLQAAITAVIDDTRKRFSIDDRRIYAAGFSGGARVATRIGYSCSGCIAGVIACGAGFPPDLPPNDTVRFAFFGTVGFGDFNYPEMIRLNDQLDGLGLPHRIAFFDGVHQWASPELLVAAVEWMELQAMRSGRRVRDEAFIEMSWNRDLQQARADETAGKTFEAHRGYLALASDYRLLKNVAEYEKKAASLRQTKAFKEAVIAEQRQIQMQEETAAQIISLGGLLLSQPASRAETMKELRMTVERVRRIGEATNDTAERRAAKRALLQVLGQTFEAAIYNYRPNKQYDIAIVNLQVAEEVSPQNAGVSFELSRIYALTDDKTKALDALKRAVAKGVSSWTLIDGQDDFDSIRSNEEFKAIVSRLKERGSAK
jgi:dienelactone hydrolase